MKERAILQPLLTRPVDPVHLAQSLYSGIERVALDDKQFATLRARYALQGIALYRSDPRDGPVSYWVRDPGQVRRASGQQRPSSNQLKGSAV